jgi:transcriptional regulator GlxA family with amidase domain
MDMRFLSHGARVLIVAVPPVRTLDLFGAAEVFGDANRLHGGDLAYEVNIISSGPERVVLSHMGTPLNTDKTYRECHRANRNIAGGRVRQSSRDEV